MPVFQTERTFGQCLVDEGTDLGQFHGLGHKVVRPGFHGLHGHINTPKGRHQDDLRLWPGRVDLAHELHPTHARHAQIGQDHIDIVLFEDLQGDFGTRGRRHLIPFAGEIVA